MNTTVRCISSYFLWTSHKT